MVFAIDEERECLGVRGFEDRQRRRRSVGWEFLWLFSEYFFGSELLEERGSGAQDVLRIPELQSFWIIMNAVHLIADLGVKLWKSNDYFKPQ